MDWLSYFKQRFAKPTRQANDYLTKTKLNADKYLEDHASKYINQGQRQATYYMNQGKKTVDSAKNAIDNTHRQLINTKNKVVAGKQRLINIKTHYQEWWRKFSFSEFSRQIAQNGYKFITTSKPYRIGKWGLILGLIGRVGYVYGTRFERNITVTKTFHRLRERRGNPSNQYLIADQQHLIYEVTSSVWYMQWYPTELWSKFQEDHQYRITGYGVRIRKLGIHPRVVQAKTAEEINMEREIAQVHDKREHIEQGQKP